MRKSTLYQKQSDKHILIVNNKVFYICNKNKRHKTNVADSKYKYECDYCIHAVDKHGRNINDMDDDKEHTPHQLWCPFMECPYKDYFEGEK